ncbi:MAG: leucine-rich repeat protein [Clostridia bacterium]|nr:leucine-rich repeat protein [Clostridia bacterium]
MKKHAKIFLAVLMVFVVSITTLRYNGKEIETSSLININECSNEFMEKYFTEMSKISEEDKPNILIVTSKTKIVSTYGAKNVIAAPNNQYMLVYDSKEAKDEAKEKLTKVRGLVSVEENIEYKISAYNSWGVTSTGMDQASARLEARAGKDDIVVAIIDTGLDVALFKSKYPTKLAGTYNSLTNSTAESAMSDENSHGTHIAGTIAESTPSNVKILPAKASSGSSLLSTDIIRAINYIVNNKAADVINMSYGSYTTHTATHVAIKAATEAGIICVAAAGNEELAQKAYPAGYPETIAVSAIDSMNSIASFSNVGTNIDFAAPGVNINSINGYKSGTSMAAPHVAAAVAIVKSYNEDFTKEQVVDILKANAVDLGTPGWDYVFGYGAINFIGFNYCTCNCATCDSVACTGCSCVTCVHKDITENITSISVSKIVQETYNYGSISNLANMELKLYYSSGNLTKKLGDLENVTVTGYDPYKYTSQVITITFAGKSTQVTLPARTEPQSFWSYEVVSGTNIKLSGMKTTPVKWLHLPEKIGSYTVTAIKSGLFKEKDLTIVTMPSTITSIESEAFAGSTVREIKAGASTLTLGSKAFSKATNLEKINSFVKLTGEDVFEECYSLTYVKLSTENISIPGGTFYLCTNLESITIPTAVTTIGDYAFTNTRINNLTIPNNVTSIGKAAFANSFNLETLNLSTILKTIGESGFASAANLKSLSIPATVTSIGTDAFRTCTGLNTITVASENTYYDSRENCNALIDSTTDTLIIGTNNTTSVPGTVKTIGDMAFAFNHLLYEIRIGEGVKTIKSNAFYNTYYLQVAILPETLTTIETGAFNYTPYLTLWVHSDSYGKTYATSNSRAYRCYNPSNLSVTGIKTTYTAFEKVSTTGVYLTAKYSDYDGTRTETISSGITIGYTGGNTSLRATDTYITISAYNSVGYHIIGRVNITVNKATPSYVVPTGLSGVEGQKLSEIVLPTGFSWQTPNTILSGVGNKTYKVNYTPTDTVNYNTVTGIDVTITVVAGKTIITPTITITDKTYDGKLSIDVATIKVAELKSTEYVVTLATLSSANVGTVNATIKIKLTNDKFKTTAFTGNAQEYQTTVSMKIVHAKVAYPTRVNKEYVYNGKEQTFEVTGLDTSIMSITGNKRTNAGSQSVIIKLTNSNYTWTDGTKNNLSFTFEIKKASIVYTAEDGHYVVDGQGYGITLNVTSPTTATIKYADASGNYTLSTMPKYTAAGTYTIKFKISAGDNYNEVTDERKLYIYAEGIINKTKDKEVIYDGLEHTLTMDINIGDVTIKYSVGNTKYDLDKLPMFKNVGEYVVNYKIEKTGLQTIYGSNKVKIYGVKTTGSSLRIDGNYLKIKDFKTNYADIISKLNIYAPSHTILAHDKNGVDKNTSTMFTGDYISIYIHSALNSKEFKYTVVILGDANLDGKISALDYVRIKNHIMKDPEIKDSLSLLSADANDDGKVSALDYVRIKNHIMDGGK